MNSFYDQVISSCLVYLSLAQSQRLSQVLFPLFFQFMELFAFSFKIITETLVDLRIYGSSLEGDSKVADVCKYVNTHMQTHSHTPIHAQQEVPCSESSLQYAKDFVKNSLSSPLPLKSSGIPLEQHILREAFPGFQTSYAFRLALLASHAFLLLQHYFRNICLKLFLSASPIKTCSPRLEGPCVSYSTVFTQ